VHQHQPRNEALGRTETRTACQQIGKTPEPVDETTIGLGMLREVPVIGGKCPEITRTAHHLSAEDDGRLFQRRHGAGADGKSGAKPGMARPLQLLHRLVRRIAGQLHEMPVRRLRRPEQQAGGGGEFRAGRGRETVETAPAFPFARKLAGGDEPRDGGAHQGLADADGRTGLDEIAGPDHAAARLHHVAIDGDDETGRLQRTLFDNPADQRAERTFRPVLLRRHPGLPRFDCTED